MKRSRELTLESGQGPFLEDGISRSHTNVGVFSLLLDAAFDTTPVDGTLVPLLRVFRVIGLRDLTIQLIRGIVWSVYTRRGMMGVADMVSGWHRQVRVILADEPYTRTAVGGHGVLHSKSALNSEYLYTRLDQNPCRSVTLKSYAAIIKHQGTRSIPPFMFDPLLIDSMKPNPSFMEKSQAVHVSNLKRLLPPGGAQKVRDALIDFADAIEREFPHDFDFKSVAQQLGKIFKKPRDNETSRVTISFHASLEFSRSQGGKTRELLRKFVDEFCNMNIMELFPTRPIGPLIDILGYTALTPEDWDSGTTVLSCLYLSVHPESLGTLDSRLCHIALFWALRTIRLEENIVVEALESYPETNVRYGEPAALKIISGSVKARLDPQPEEGDKVRSISIASLAISFIGGFARHLLDEDLYSVKDVNAGLLSKVKLYTVLDLIGGKGSADPGKMRYNCAKGTAISADLTNATNTPPLKHAKAVLSGHLAGTDHKGFEAFLTLSVEIAVLPREFVLTKGVVGPVPRVHRNGIMMGEGLSGVFLNDCSLMTRRLAPLARKRFVFLQSDEQISNDEMDQWLIENRKAFQEFLNDSDISEATQGSQSGDDVIEFDDVNLGRAFRAVYRAQGFVPSSTFYVSDCYGLFCEEGALKTVDSNGWKFVDSIKPRAFSFNSGDSDGKAIISKMKLITSYVRYMSEDNPIRMAATRESIDMIMNIPVWNRIIKDNDISIGLPEFLGGLGHPIGLTENYLSTLSLEDLQVIKGISEMEPLEAYSMLFDLPDSVVGSEIEETLRQEIKKVVDQIGRLTLLGSWEKDLEGDIFSFDINQVLPQLPKENWFTVSQRRKKFCKKNDLISVSEFITNLSGRLEMQVILEEGKSDAPSQMAWNSMRSRVRKLREQFCSEESTVTASNIGELSIWKIKERVMANASRVVIPVALSEKICKLRDLPTMTLERSPRRAGPESGVETSNT